MLDEIGLDPVAQVVYSFILDAGSVSEAELARQLNHPEHTIQSALESLTRWSLVQWSGECQDERRVQAVSPVLAMGALIHRRQAELVRHQAELTALQGSAAALLARSCDPPASAAPLVSKPLFGNNEMLRRLAELAADAKDDLLALGLPALPCAGLRSLEELLLARGITWRVASGHTLYSDPLCVEETRRRLAAGVQVRVSTRVLPRVFVFDSSLVLLLMDPQELELGGWELTGAVAGVIHAFAESLWEHSLPFAPSSPRDERGLSVQEAAVLRMLSTGLTDDQVARRLGVSSRTVGRTMAALMDKVQASSRFEAGIRVVECGWLG